MLLTIFTPTFNRAYILPRLYDSLCSQTSKDFEWILVDDGSTDNTQELAKEWLAQNKINMRYIKQNNLGKPIAHNRGVEEAIGNLFVCVDSDDFLINKAVEKIIKISDKINNTDLVGILAFRGYQNGNSVTVLADEKVKKTTLRDAYKKYGLHGDTMLIYKTDVIKRFHFDVAEGEKFIPETYLYNQIDNVGKMYIYRESLYMCEYLPDGLTYNVAKNLYNNYKSYVIYMNSRLKSNESLVDKIKDTMRYEAIMLAHKEKKIIANAVYPWMAIIGWLPAYIIAKKKYGGLGNGE